MKELSPVTPFKGPNDEGGATEGHAREFNLRQNELIQRDEELLEELNSKEAQTASLKHGQNIVEADQSSVADVVIEGRTRVNLFGKRRIENENSSRIFPGAHSNVNTSVGEHYDRYMQIVNVKPIFGNRFINQTSGVFDFRKLGLNKHFIVLLDAISDTSIPVFLQLKQDGLTRTIKRGVNSGLVEGQLKTVSMLFQVDQDVKENATRFLFEVAGNDAPATIGVNNLRIYELTQEEYNLALTVGDDVLGKQYPYIDGVQHVQNPIITKKGNNLLSPFSVLTNDKPYEGVIPSTGSYRATRVTIPVIGGEIYTLSAILSSENQNSPDRITLATRWRVTENGADIQLNTLDLNMAYIDRGEGLRIRTNAAPLNANYLTIYLWRSGTYSGDDLRFKNLMLNMGEYQPFQPQNDDSLYMKSKLASTLDGAVKDIIYKKGDRYVLRESLTKDIIFNGSEDWTFRDNVDGIVICSLNVANYPHYIKGVGREDFHGQLEDGFVPKFLPSVSGYPTGIRDVINTELISMFGGSSIDDRIIYLALNVSRIGGDKLDDFKAFLSKNPLTMSWQLSTPNETEVALDGSIGIDNSFNLIEVDSGVIIQEVVTPLMATGNLNINAGIRATQLKNRPSKILEVRKNGTVDGRWRKFIRANSSTAIHDLGLAGAEIPNFNEKDLDMNDVYSVTYMLMDRHKFTTNIEKASVTYQTTLKAAHEKSVQQIVGNTSAISSINLMMGQMIKAIRILGGE